MEYMLLIKIDLTILDIFLLYIVFNGVAFDCNYDQKHDNYLILKINLMFYNLRIK